MFYNVLFLLLVVVLLWLSILKLTSYLHKMWYFKTKCYFKMRSPEVYSSQWVLWGNTVKPTKSLIYRSYDVTQFYQTKKKKETRLFHCPISRMIPLASVLPLFLVLLCFPSVPLSEATAPPLFSQTGWPSSGPHAVWKLLHCIGKSVGGTKEEEEQGAVVEVIRKPDPWLGFKGNWISLQCLLISQECCWSPWYYSEFKLRYHGDTALPPHAIKS